MKREKTSIFGLLVTVFSIVFSWGIVYKSFSNYYNILSVLADHMNLTGAVTWTEHLALYIEYYSSLVFSVGLVSELLIGLLPLVLGRKRDFALCSIFIIMANNLVILVFLSASNRFFNLLVMAAEQGAF